MTDNTTDYNKINRRRFMQKTAVAGTVIAGTSLITSPAVASPKRGGILRVGISSGATTDTFDPRKVIDGVHISLIRTVYNTLVQVDKDGKLQPELAESWDVSSDGLTWTFNLRKGIKFSNNREFTAKDVVYSLKMHLAKDSGSGFKGFIKDWVEIKNDGKYAVKIVLSGINQDLPWILNLPGFVIVQDGHTDWFNPIGTGGYDLKSFKPGVRAEFIRKDNYWKADAGYVDEIQLISILDMTARQNALLSGQVDVIDNVPPRTAKLLGKVSKVDLVYYTTGQYYCNPMITTNAPFSDPNVRLAIKHGIDRETILNNVFLGFGEIGNDNPIPRKNEFYNPNLEQYKKDPDKAKFYLKKSGLSKLDINLSTNDKVYPGAVDTAVIMQESLKDSNINLAVTREAADGYWSNVWMKKSFTTSWWAARPVAALVFKGTYSSTSSWNDTFYYRDNVDNLIKVLQENPNYETRKSAAWEIQEIIHGDGGMLIPIMAQLIDAKSKKLSGIESHPVYALNDYRFADKAWFN